ncbi:hypothetical protein V1509DRAFT_636638 [Lipomyces kononenkoae]
MDVDEGNSVVSDSDQTRDVEQMSSDAQMVIAPNSDISSINENDDDVGAPMSSTDVVPYERGLIRRRADLKPGISDEEDSSTIVVKRTRRSPGNEVAISGINTNERTWRPVERGMVLQGDGGVVRPDAPRGDDPHADISQQSEPRNEWAVDLPRHTRSSGPPTFEYAHAICERILMVNELKEH